jgi:putative transposase
MEKVAPSERFRSELDEVLAGVSGEEDPIETVGRLGARLILQQALEDEVTEFLGRGRYERSDETVSHRNGYEQRTVKTTSGSMRLERPRIRDASSSSSSGHDFVGMTRTPGKAGVVRDAGAKAVVSDMLDAAAVRAALRVAQPEVVVHQLTFERRDDEELLEHPAGSRSLPQTIAEARPPAPLTTGARPMRE